MSDQHVMTVNGYTLLGKVSEGGFGTIYRATQAHVVREVAIKVVRP
jgi:serine/threonine protein kinase